MNEPPAGFARGLTLLIPRRADRERDAVAAAWVGRGGTVVRLDRFWEPPPIPPAEVRLYGPETFARVVAEQLAVDLVSPPDDWMAGLAPRWLSRRVEVKPLAEALEGGFPRFVKALIPKLFPSQVYPRAAVLARATANLRPDELVLLADPVAFACEVRAFLRDQRVVAAALYRGAVEGQDGLRTVAEAASFAGEAARASGLGRTAVLDVGKLEGGAWAVVEANATWGSGLNGCAPVAAAWCVEAATAPRLKPTGGAAGRSA